MQFCSLASGSNGNCYYISEGDSRILVDLGISCKQAEQSLWEIGVDPATIRAVLVTHEHSDHIKGIGVWMRRYRTPVLSTERTLQAMVTARSLGAVPMELLYPIRAERRYNAEGISIETFSPFHDAADPIGYSLFTGEKRVTIMTDTGMASPDMERLLKESCLAVVESNYDPDMLRFGSYPPPLKKRIRSNVGHMSNEDCGRLLQRVLPSNPQMTVLLGHLSEENNTPELALRTVREMVREVFADEQCIQLTHRGERTHVYEL